MKLVLRILLLVLPQLFVIGNTVSFASFENTSTPHKKNALTYTASDNQEFGFFEEFAFDADDETEGGSNSVFNFSEVDNVFSGKNNLQFFKNRGFLAVNKKLYLLFGNIKIPV
jgi:hypothetical protein